ncbi:MAG: URC4/urg3 family protein [Elioraea sp.]|nr:URC4/urg3 family protein [Elioraea sp.]
MSDAALLDASALLTPEAVRERAQAMLALARADRTLAWRLDETRLETVADRVAAVTRATFPDLAVPLHARWRHFLVGGRDLWAEAAAASGLAGAERARAAFDTAVVSVLLDAGAGPAWRYRAKNGTILSRSEGLAVASLELLGKGAFSSRRRPLEADAEGLTAVTADLLAEGFRASEANPLVGLAGRAALLRRLGETVAADAALRDPDGRARPGALFDLLAARAAEGTIQARDILVTVLQRFGAIWPGRISLGGVALGDCWPHPLLGPVPLHKLPQWLAWSLIEPLRQAGLRVAGMEALTGLAEYRNGGLFVDGGVLRLRDPAEAEREHDVGAPLVVEWRALTVALLDELAPLVRARLGLDEARFPLGALLEGGTWRTGRMVARERRADGGPPIRVASDGTVF